MRAKLAALAGLTLAAAASERAAVRPHLLLALFDDSGYGDVSAYGAPDLRTPHLDRLAAEGIRFTAMRANATVCSPTRAAILTGRYADRVGVPGVIRTHPKEPWGWFAPGVPTLPELLRGGGCRTALVGKWHLGLASPNLPNERGFDVFRGFLGDMMDSYTTHLRHGQHYLRHDDREIQAKGHATELFTGWACKFIRSAAAQPNRPFFISPTRLSTSRSSRPTTASAASWLRSTRPAWQPGR